jgi:hypothetical protein
MWRLFISEFFYNKRILSFLIGVSFFNLIAIHNWPLISGETPPNMNTGYLSISHIFYYFVIAILMMTWFNKEKKERLYIQLPITVIKIGILRLLIFITYWIILLALLYCFTYMSKYYSVDQTTILSVISQTGIAFSIFSLFFYWQDLRGHISGKNKTSHSLKRKIIGTIAIVLTLMFGFIATAGIVHNYQIQDKFGAASIDIWKWIYKSQAGAIIFFTTSLLMALLTIVTYRKRKSYI